MRGLITTAWGVLSLGLLVAWIAPGCDESGSDTGGRGAGGESWVPSDGGYHGGPYNECSPYECPDSGPPDDDGTPAGAHPIAVGGKSTGEIDPLGDVDYYTFTGKKGQAVEIRAIAQGSAGAFDPDTIDTVITLSRGNKDIAFNNDPYPWRDLDARLITILPADDTYFVSVTDCWSRAEWDSDLSCWGTADAVFDMLYTIELRELDPAEIGTIRDAELGDTAATATPLTYAQAMDGPGYAMSTVYGTFRDAADVDVFSFTIPADAGAIPAGTRGYGAFHLQQDGVSGNGSTAWPGNISIIDATDPSIPITVASISGLSYDGRRIAPPLTFGKQYLLSVSSGPGGSLDNPFYVMLHESWISAALETDDAANDVLAGAQVAEFDGGSFYVEGDLVNGGADVDYWRFSVANLGTWIAFGCEAERAGSGLRGFHAELVYQDAANAEKALAKADEFATKDAYSDWTKIPALVGQMYLKLSSTQPKDPAVASAFYRCGIHFAG